MPIAKSADSEVRSGKLWVTTHYPRLGTEKTKESRIEVSTFETTPAIVKASCGLTLNLGDYNSVRLDVGIELPCYMEEKEDAMNKALVFVQKRIEEEAALIRSGKLVEKTSKPVTRSK